jgi:hypothetical protein
MIKMSKLKITILIVGVFVAGVTVWVVYFTSHVSAVISPIKEYKVAAPGKDKPEQVVLDVIKADSCLSYKVTSITDKKDDRKYFMDITLKYNSENYLYHVCVETTKAFLGSSKHTNLYITGAFNPVEETGGYKIEDNGVQDLVRQFEKAVVNKLPKN